jgi:NitT/TauT family transport system permease protein
MTAEPIGTSAGGMRREAGRRRWLQLRGLLDRIVAIFLLLALWQLAADHWLGDKWISTPLKIAVRLQAMLADGTIQIHTWETFKEAAVGLLVGIVLGVALGLLLGVSRRLSAAVDPVLMGIYSLPRVSLAPMFVIWLGIGLVAKAALVASMVVFVVMFNVREGVRNIDRDVIDGFRSMHASRWALLRYVVIPSLVPWLLTSVRIGIGMALVGAVVGELIGSSKGLGWYISYASSVYDMTGAFTALVVLTILAMLFNLVLSLLERRLLFWRRGEDGGAKH